MCNKGNAIFLLSVKVFNFIAINYSLFLKRFEYIIEINKNVFVWNIEPKQISCMNFLLHADYMKCAQNKGKKIRNSGWHHLNNHDILLMPDKWEFPWVRHLPYVCSSWINMFHLLGVEDIFLQSVTVFKTFLKLITKFGSIPGFWTQLDGNI